MTEKPLIQGYCAEQFSAVSHAFAENFSNQRSSELRDIGASVAVVYQGELVVDLWGGYKDSHRVIPWEQNTLACAMSTTKAFATVAVLQLVDRKVIELEAPIADYWPEFAQAGKDKISVSCLLAQLAGLPLIENAEPNSFFTPGYLETALAAQKPLWPPGSTPCYHSFTYGPLCQILVEKVTGKSLGTYLREEILEPLDIDFHLGVPHELLTQCADVILAENIPTISQAKEDGSLMSRAWMPLSLTSEVFNSDRYRQMEFASGNGYGNARGLAKFYGALCADVKGNQPPNILSHQVLEAAIEEQWDDVEQQTERHFRYSTGFMLNNDFFNMGSSPRSFGHPGLGGALGFADPDADIAFGYLGNYVHPINNTGPCAQALIDATINSIN
ncbi:MAG: beta-lactamase family protein [Pseudomonadales bacterium]|nr:beta-lactamase family protein [Pseudomonadales bacterium]